MPFEHPWELSYQPAKPKAEYSETAEKAAELRGQLELSREAVKQCQEKIAVVEALLATYANVVEAAAAADFNVEPLKSCISNQIAYRESLTASLTNIEKFQRQVEADIALLENRNREDDEWLRQIKFKDRQ